MNTSPLGSVTNTHKGIILRLGSREKGGEWQSSARAEDPGSRRGIKTPSCSWRVRNGHTLCFGPCASPFPLLSSSAIVVSVSYRTRERWKQECRPCSFPRRTHPAAHMITLWLTPELRWATWSTHHLWRYQSEGCVHSWCMLQTEEMRSLWGYTGPGNGHVLIQRFHAVLRRHVTAEVSNTISLWHPGTGRQCLASGY